MIRESDKKNHGGELMPDTTENLLTRNLLDVFGERDAVKRRFAIAAL